MKLVQLLLTILALFSITASTPAPEPADDQVVDAGFTQAIAGMNGWYVSDVTVTAVSPVLANGRLLQAGEILSISSEGEQSIEYASPNGQSTATQIVRIDKTPPTVSINAPYLRGDGATILSVTVSDPVSHPAAVDVSLDNGLTWQTYTIPSGFSEPEVVWNLNIDPTQVHPGQTAILARGLDMAGNSSSITTFVGTGR